VKKATCIDYVEAMLQNARNWGDKVTAKRMAEEIVIVAFSKSTIKKEKLPSLRRW
jgi:hypothetical protein